MGWRPTPWLDAVVETEEFVIGVDSKRYEPFRAHSRSDDSAFSEAYWRDQWGAAMQPYQWVRDGLAHRPQLFRYLDAPQLVKHAFGLRTQSLKKGKKAALVYLFAEPKVWPGADGKAVSQDAHAGHAEEVARASPTAFLILRAGPPKTASMEEPG